MNGKVIATSFRPPSESRPSII